MRVVWLWILVWTMHSAETGREERRDKREKGESCGVTGIWGACVAGQEGCLPGPLIASSQQPPATSRVLQQPQTLQPTRGCKKTRPQVGTATANGLCLASGIADALVPVPRHQL
jgi:hypothetical protein